MIGLFSHFFFFGGGGGSSELEYMFITVLLETRKLMAGTTVGK